jgi:hypothetical protein
MARSILLSETLEYLATGTGDSIEDRGLDIVMWAGKYRRCPWVAATRIVVGMKAKRQVSKMSAELSELV